ncbi:unnamed protein product [Callosobruchus maculatus]|uniref:LITAF domain-containing protein n=1 Tax=Callosobruchus maculatus TaxID=64391 RepID=A0A653DH54_CALMS|nr:unnamed protein product [Callosobruchus maculatus]
MHRYRRCLCIGSDTKQEELEYGFEVGKRPILMTCPNCFNPQRTKISYFSTNRTDIAALCLIPFLLCWLPYCTPFFRRARHYCSVCGIYIGTSRT